MRTTVVVTYNEPQYTEDLPLSLYFPIFPEHIYRDLDREKYQDKDPVGTGPGVLKNFAGQQIEIAIRDDYWGEINPDLAEVHLVPAGTAGNIESQITQGDVDWAQGGYTRRGLELRDDGGAQRVLLLSGRLDPRNHHGHPQGTHSGSGCPPRPAGRRGHGDRR